MYTFIGDDSDLAGALSGMEGEGWDSASALSISPAEIDMAVRKHHKLHRIGKALVRLSFSPLFS